MFLPTVRHCHWQFEWAVTVSVFVFASVSVSVSVAVHPPIWESETATHGRAGSLQPEPLLYPQPESPKCHIRGRGRGHDPSSVLRRAFCIPFRIPYFVFRGRGRHTMHVHKIRGNSETRSYDVDDVMSADSAFQCRHIKC